MLNILLISPENHTLSDISPSRVNTITHTVFTTATNTRDMSEQKAESPEKRLFICCDGTWEDSNNSDQPITNVTRIARCIPSKDSEGVLQIVYYQSGIGTVC